MQSLRAIAGCYVYWPSLYDNIVIYVGSSHHCACVAASSPKSASLAWETSTYFWQRVHIDHAGPIKEENFLLSVDVTSKWVKIRQSQSEPLLSSTFSATCLPVSRCQKLWNATTVHSSLVLYSTASYHPHSNDHAGSVRCIRDDLSNHTKSKPLKTTGR